MSTPGSASPGGGMKRSQRVALVLLGTAGVVGVVTAVDAWRKAASSDVEEPVPAPTPIAEDRVYTNDQYIPGVGYYHAPYHAWFPHPFNYHDPNRGFFAGGQWQPGPWPMSLTQSMPTSAAVAAALAAQRQQQPQATPGRGGFGGSGFHGGGFSGRPSVTPSAPSHSIIRGGFGSSGHHGVS